MPHPLTLPFAPVRILVSGQDQVAIAESIRQARPDLDVRNAAPATVTTSDLEWAECFVGFRPPRSTQAMGNVRWVHSTARGRRLAQCASARSRHPAHTLGGTFDR